MPGLLQDKAIIITGGSTGIGRATALRAAQEGARLTIADVNLKDGEAVVAEIKSNGGTAQLVKTDVTQSAQVQAMIAAKTGRAFDPSGKGRPMKEWIVIAEPATNAKKKWLALAEEAKEFVKI